MAGAAGDADEADRWWERAFGPAYLSVYHHRDDRLARDETEALLPRLRAAPGPVLDACCGSGRHLGQLRAAGLTAVGFDLSAHLLGHAAQRRGCAGSVARCDMRAPSFAGGFGAVVLLFTAFGYFDDNGNASTFAGLARLVAPGGWMLLDLPDPVRLRAALVPATERACPSGHAVSERRRLDGERVVKEVAYRGERWVESVRLYQPSEIAAMASASALSLVETWPGLRGPQHHDGRHVHWLRRESIAP